MVIALKGIYQNWDKLLVTATSAASTRGAGAHWLDGCSGGLVVLQIGSSTSLFCVFIVRPIPSCAAGRLCPSLPACPTLLYSTLPALLYSACSIYLPALLYSAQLCLPLRYTSVVSTFVTVRLTACTTADNCAGAGTTGAVAFIGAFVVLINALGCLVARFRSIAMYIAIETITDGMNTSITLVVILSGRIRTRAQRVVQCK
eukprot:gene7140-7646_t